MKTKIIINGKYYDAEISDKTIKQMAAELERPKHTGFEHPGYDEPIYNINGSQYTANERETLNPGEYSDKQIRDNWRRKQQIERRLCEAAAMLNSESVDKLNANVGKYFIFWSAEDIKLSIGCIYSACDIGTLFKSREAAQQAIDIVGKDDLIWLFRDFQPYIGAYKETADE